MCGRTRADLREIIGNITDEIFQKYIKEQTETKSKKIKTKKKHQEKRGKKKKQEKIKKINMKRNMKRNMKINKKRRFEKYCFAGVVVAN